MNPRFEVIFLEQAIDFITEIDPKSKKKIYYNINKAKKAFRALEANVKFSVEMNESEFTVA